MISRSLPLFVLGASLAGLNGITVAASSPLTAEQTEFFEKKIRPVLVAECVECHNADKQKGGLRLDYRDGWKKGGDSGETIVPGDPKDSLLLRTIRHEEEDLKMPSKAPKLDPAVIADFEAWVKMGAPDPRDTPAKSGESESKWAQLLALRRGWWSLQPVRVPPVPTPKRPGTVHPVDRFLAEKREEKGLSLAAPADAPTVLRRLSFLLTGLAPTPGQVAGFVAAYEADPGKAVDEAVEGFLASDRFGEHWARHWMDLMRYSESHGSELDETLPMAWRYRDYLVRALNQDVPLDALIREHLAGDLLSEPRVGPEGLNESRLGPAHFRMVEHGANAVDTRDDQVRVLDNQIDVVSKAFQGMTVACARCHDHKFDAISHRDYHALQGVFASMHLGQVAVDQPGHLQKQLPVLEQTHERIRAALAAHWLRAADRFPEWLGREINQEDDRKQAFAEASKDPSHALHAWVNLANETAGFGARWESLRARVGKEMDARRQSNAAKFERAWDFRAGETAGWVRSGPGLERKAEAGWFQVSAEGDLLLGELYPPALLSHRFSSKHPGTLVSPVFTVGHTRRMSARVLGGNAVVRIVPDNYAVAKRFDAKAVLQSDRDAWVLLDPLRREGNQARLEVATEDDLAVGGFGMKPRKKEAANRAFFGVAEVVFHKTESNATPLGEADPWSLLAEHGAPGSLEALAELYTRVLKEAIGAWREHRLSESHWSFLNAFVRAGLFPIRLSELPELAPLVAQYRAAELEVPVPRRAPGVYDMAGQDAPLLERGDHKRPKAPVPRGYLEVLGKGPFRSSGSGRLELAEQIASAENPLTARVMANRIWYWVYGVGIVPTVDNFGRMGEKPTHPELLEYLAHRLVEKGWSLKEMLRFLAGTETFRAGSRAAAVAGEVDPANQWLSHMRVRRLEAESIRDSLLQVSGRLADTLGGPSVGEGDMTRRSVYHQVRRALPNAFLATFDAPIPFTTFGRRDVTNVPAQSLTLLNGPFATRCASDWAARLLKTAPDAPPEARIETMFLSALARPPRPEETRALLDCLNQIRGANPGASGAGKVENAAWSHLAHILFNLKEFIYLP
jgi:hypothetical protein